MELVFLLISRNLFSTSPSLPTIQSTNGLRTAGVLYNVLSVPNITANATLRSLVARTLDHLVSLQQPSGNFPTEYYQPSDDVLVQVGPMSDSAADRAVGPRSPRRLGCPHPGIPGAISRLFASMTCFHSDVTKTRLCRAISSLSTILR